MSTSQAPSATVRAASKALTSGKVAPSGKPTTVQTRVSDPRSSSAHSGTQVGFTHTVAKPCSRASAQSCSIWARVASGLSRVWSMVRAISRE
jgi:hypothetical protein